MTPPPKRRPGDKNPEPSAYEVHQLQNAASSGPGMQAGDYGVSAILGLLRFLGRKRRERAQRRMIEAVVEERARRRYLDS